jgi:hypothetical protein
MPTASPEIKARPTLYKGIRMRSRLEAQYAALLDDYGVNWEYEPECFAGPEGQWLPDFRRESAHGPEYIELKPLYLFNADNYPRVDDRNNWVDEILTRMAVAWHSEPKACLRLIFFDYSHDYQSVTITGPRQGKPWNVSERNSLLVASIWPGMGQGWPTEPRCATN